MLRDRCNLHLVRNRACSGEDRRLLLLILPCLAISMEHLYLSKTRTLDPVSYFDGASRDTMPTLNPAWAFTSQPSHDPPNAIYLESIIQHLAKRGIEFEVFVDIRQISTDLFHTDS